MHPEAHPSALSEEGEGEPSARPAPGSEPGTGTEVESARFWVDREGRVRRWGPGAERLFGYDAGRALGLDLDTLLAAPSERGIWSRVRSLLEVEGRWEDLGWRSRADGTRFWGRCVIEVAGEPAGGWVAVTCTAAADDARTDPGAFRLQSLGRAASGVAHDLGNILMAIECFAGLLESELPRSGAARETIGHLIGATRRGIRLSQGVLGVGRDGDERAVDAGTCVRQMEPILRTLLPAHVALTTRWEPELPRVVASERDLELILLNLVANARDAIDGEGRVEVTVGRADGSGRSGPIRLRVRDSGSGIPASIRDRVFDRFFSTKGAGAGSGLGLSMVLEAVRASGGRLELRSTPGEGTTVDVFLEPVPTGVAAGVPLGLVRRRGRIVLWKTPGSETVRPLELLLRRRGFDVLLRDLTSAGRTAGDGGTRLPVASDLSLVELPADPAWEFDPSGPCGCGPGGAPVLYLRRPGSADAPAGARVLELPCDPVDFLIRVGRLVEGSAVQDAQGLH